ncbi:MAG: hypothetical protein ACE5I3_01700 [Phycisphaerae bacterium]
MVRSRRNWLRLTLVLLPVAVLGLLLSAGAALTCRPAWYRPVSIDYSRLPEDKRAQLRLENEISAALNRNAPIEIELDEAQVNRWIAARHELWPTEAPSLEPFQRPQVVFRRGNRVRLAALVEQSGMQVVLSATFHVDLQPDALVVTWDAVHAGALPTPRKLIEKAARKLTRRLGLAEQDVTHGRMTLPVEGTWPNGKRRVRIANLVISDGVVHVSLAPL